MAEETYRNPLFGRRVDRYIPPELRQGLGALLAGADMLNPVSAYREYLKDVREGDVVGGVTNAAGFVAPGVASAVASRLARPAVSAVAPYGEDAARVLMEVLSPTGAPEVSRSPMDMSRREFLAGLGAAAATPALPVDEMLEGLGRAGARGGGRLGAGLSRINDLRSGIEGIYEEMRALDPGARSHSLEREISDLERGYFDDIDAFGRRLGEDEVARMIGERRAEIERIRQSIFEPSSRVFNLRRDYDRTRDEFVDLMISDPDAYIRELGELGDDELRSLSSELGEYFSNMSNVDRLTLKKYGHEPSEIASSFGRFGSALRDEVARRDLGDEALGDAEYLVRDALPDVMSAYRLEGSKQRYSADFNSMLPDVASRMVSGGDEFRRGLGSSGETVSSIPAREGVRAYHGSPHTFERFDMSKIGTGEGAQAYGRGLYFAEAEDVARGYRERLSYGNIKNKFLEELPADADFEEVDDLIEQNYFTPDQTQFLKELKNNDWLGFDYPSQAITAATRGSLDDYDPSPALKDAIDKLGRMYEVRIDADPEDFLDWDKPLSEQPQVARALGYAAPEEIAAMKDEVRAGLARIAPDGDLSRFFDSPTPEFERLRQLDSEARRLSDWTGMTGQDLGFRLFQDPVHSATNVKDAARSGIPGIRYLDAGSRGAGDGSRNYVVFDDRLISIVRMYGIGGAAALLGVTAADVEQALANNLSQGELEGLLSGPQSRPD